MCIRDRSKGQAERLDLGMLLAREADVYLLDEPLGGVDPVERAHILNEVMAFLEEDRTVLMATHLVHDIEPVSYTHLDVYKRQLSWSGPEPVW